jgi:hypothetical protein
MKSVNLVIVNPDGVGPWLSRMGRNSKDEEATIIFKLRGDESQSERIKLLHDQVRGDVILGRDAVLKHLDTLGLGSGVKIKDRADFEEKKNMLTKTADKFLNEVLVGGRELPKNFSVEIKPSAKGDRTKFSEKNHVKSERFSFKRFFTGLLKTTKPNRNIDQVLDLKQMPAVDTGLHTVSASSNNKMDGVRRERMHVFNPGYMNLTPEKLQREVDKLALNNLGVSYRSNLRDAVSIQESLWVTWGTADIDTDLDVADPNQILATLRSISKLDLSNDAKQSIDVLGVAVTHYTRMLKNKTPEP